MDASEATKIVMSRIQSLDPENASKIMGYILIQDQGDKEMIRLAFSPDALLLSHVEQAKVRLGLSENSPFGRRIVAPNNGLHLSCPKRPPSYVLDSCVGDEFFGGGSDPMAFPCDEDVGLLEGGGVLWRPCLYFARGFCKNGGSCKFLHSGEGIMAAGSHYPFGNLRGELPGMGIGASSSRQIYLTFPADSTFKEEDVSNYFSLFGPVQDVRIPYQQKRMFGFVTFVYPETVRLILAKGNPHFLCDCRVLVKPYKEKGKVRERKQQQQQQQLERVCLSPPGVDPQDNVEFPFGSQMVMSPQEMTIRRNLELQHAVELQGRRMMDLRLMTVGSNPNHTPLFMRGFPYSSPRQLQFLTNQCIAASDSVNEPDSEVFAITELDGAQEASSSTCEKPLVVEATESSIDDNINGTGHKCSSAKALPDNLFASSAISSVECLQSK